MNLSDEKKLHMTTRNVPVICSFFVFMVQKLYDELGSSVHTRIVAEFCENDRCIGAG